MNCIFWSQMSNRPWVNRPIASYHLSRWLEQHDYTCQVIEFVHLFTGEELAEYTAKFISDDTLYIGVSTTMWSTFNENLRRRTVNPEVPDNILTAVKILKAKYPTVKFVIGGPMTNSLPNLSMFDYKNSEQYAEDSLLKLTDMLARYKLKHKFKLRQPFNFDTFEFTWKEHDCLFHGEAVPIEMSRGCIFKCSFCRDPLIGKKLGTLEKHFETLKAEFIKNYELAGITRYTFITDTFNDYPEKIEMMARLYKELPFELEWLSWFRLDLIAKNPEQIQLLLDSGCRGAYFGVESFHPKAAATVKKAWMAKHAKEWISKCVKAWKDRIYITTSMIVGLPYEDEQSIREGIHWIANSGVYAFPIFSLAMGKATASSTFEDDPAKYGITFEKYNPDGTPVLEDHAQWWKHDIMDWDRAKELSGELTRQYFLENNIHIFNLGSWWTTGGNDVEFRNIRRNIKTEGFVDNRWDLEKEYFEKYKKMLAEMALKRLPIDIKHGLIYNK